MWHNIVVGSQALGAAIGISYLWVALALARHARGSIRMFPWLIVLAAFFAIRGVDRLTETLAAVRPPFTSQLSDTLVLVTLVLLLFGLQRTVAGLRDAFEASDTRQVEYSRALTDYERLTRHRLANPLAALRGGIATLREVDGLSEEDRKRLLQMLEAEAIRLEKISLDPRRLSPEERNLRPLPGAEFPDAA